MRGIDTNILLYAYDRSSMFFEPAKQFITGSCEEGLIAIADLSLVEFYSVITDGRKVSNPLLPSEATDIIHDILSADEFDVFYSNQSILDKTLSYIEENNISRFGINEVYIAQTLAHYGIDKIFTANIKDFSKFDFIEPINPFKSVAMRSAPCTSRIIPYGHQSIDESDIAAVCSVFRSDWLTTGPKVEEFEKAIADYVGAEYAVAVSNGTAALHCAMYALGIGPGDEVILPPMTFAATANCVVFQGGTPIFTDVDPDTLLIDPIKVEAVITEKTKAIIAVDYAGQPCDYDKLHEKADKHDLALVADGCHALGAEYKGKKVGSLADMTVFSFHPVKHITTGEGGMITTDDESLANRMRLFRNHGITRETQSAKRQALSSPLHAPCSMPFYYEMIDLGYNYRITDIQSALGLSQLKKLPGFLQRRGEIAAIYDEALADIPEIKPLGLRADVLPAKHYAKRQAPTTKRNTPSSMPSANSSMLHAPSSMLSKHVYHLYVIRLEGVDREKVFKSLRERGIGVNVHYIPVYLHPFYRNRFGIGPGHCPIAESAYESIISLPIFPGMSDEDVERIITYLKKSVNKSNQSN